jgi:ribosome-associated translation inhibitor RaiA
MDIEKLEHIIHSISKGDTSVIEVLFKKPGGRKFLEGLVVIVISRLPYMQEEKEDLFIAFRKALDKIEKRIKHQKEGQKILQQIYG